MSEKKFEEEIREEERKMLTTKDIAEGLKITDSYVRKIAHDNRIEGRGGGRGRGRVTKFTEDQAREIARRWNDEKGEEKLEKYLKKSREEERKKREEERKKRGKKILKEWLSFAKEFDSAYIKLMIALNASRKDAIDKEEFLLLGWMQAIRYFLEGLKEQIFDEFYEAYQIDIDKLIEEEVESEVE